jgi:phosphoadenosine phosphosulfate reductase
MTLKAKIQEALAVLEQAASSYAPVGFANSLGAEDMVLTDLIAKHLPARHTPVISIFTLDTGRLPQETYELMHAVRAHYGQQLHVYFPDAALVERYVTRYGVNGFYDSVENRKRCCYIRKVEPLQRALNGKRAWLTGLRREQAPTRTCLAVSGFDADNGLQKFNPLLGWTNDDVWTYIRENGVPYNALHDRFYPSIGCAPCTRAITPGEDLRAGRWWWEHPEGKECGLHVAPVARVSATALGQPVRAA